MANELGRLIRGGNPIGAHLPVLPGMSFAKNPATDKPLLRLPSTFVRRFRRSLGYLGEIHLLNETRGVRSLGGPTPA